MIKPIRILLGALLALPAQASFASTYGIVISQAYGGGGHSGATYKANFTRVFNVGTVPVDISTQAVQYAPAAGTSWVVINLTSGTVVLQPGQY